MKTVVITGASRGIGAAIAELMRERGYKVTGTSRAGSHGTLPLDLDDDASIAKFAADVTQPVDVLINNAAIATIHPKERRMEHGKDQLTREEFSRILETNVVGTYMVTKALLPRLREGQRKIIINLSSGLGSIAQNNTGGRYAYRCSKAAVNMLTKSLSVDLGKEGYTCVAWSPGWVKTDMGGDDADLTPEESARALVDFVEKSTVAENGKFLDHRLQNVDW